MNKLHTLWRNINDSLWFVPTLMVAAAMVLAYGLVRLDMSIEHGWVKDYPLLFGAGASGARGVLTAIAGSMMTVASLGFSLTLSTLGQVSSQYTSRVLRNFMSSRVNQMVLGSFVSIFVYCLLVLRTIRDGDEGGFIPPLAVTGGLILAVLSIGVLVFFIHHIASIMQAGVIIEGVAEETEAAIRRLFPQELGTAASEPAQQALFEKADKMTWVPVPAEATGYVQRINEEGLITLARRLNGVVRMERGVGGFVAQGAPLASIASYTGGPALTLTDELLAELNGQFSTGRQRTTEQDAGFGVRQLVDIALKALSPGINDTSTAVMCIDYLGALVVSLAARRFTDPLRTDEDGPVRIITVQPSFATFVNTAFDQILVSGEGNLAVYLRLLTALDTAASRTQVPARLAVLHAHATRVTEAATQTLTAAYDRDQVQARARKVLPRLS
ncbi:DUF2254 domain-containing protein [Hymenobacter sp. H14-R3]|uniref:DUF2254 domain-containing protein n=1 Tax=Hymenobacter sp. H14-R3 TaxID=3046308 RepID=UPI0024BA93F7|nr:DUF2254 domain-containing protein [Hymenobacter sp. H14-R3]MDJ0366349.1 DUF2254 domain-containing protein [Hymenobacter sp. H14-R3]